MNEERVRSGCDPDGRGAEAGVNAAKMLADLQPCDGVTVSSDALGVAGYSLGAGRAVRGAAGSTVRFFGRGWRITTRRRMFLACCVTMLSLL